MYKQLANTEAKNAIGMFLKYKYAADLVLEIISFSHQKMMD